MYFFMCPYVYISLGRYSFGIIGKKNKMDSWTQETPCTHICARLRTLCVYMHVLYVHMSI